MSPRCLFASISAVLSSCPTAHAGSPASAEPAEEAASKPVGAVIGVFDRVRADIAGRYSSGDDALSGRFALDLAKTARLKRRLWIDYRSRGTVLFNNSDIDGGNDRLSHNIIQGSLTLELSDRVVLETGVINKFLGTGFGFNPTDIFRSDAGAFGLSLLPSENRQNRSGRVMSRLSYTGEFGQVELIFAPKVRPGQLLKDFGVPSASEKGVLAAILSVDSASFAPQLLFFREGADLGIGGGFSQTLGDATVIYGEATYRSRSREIAQRNGPQFLSNFGASYALKNTPLTLVVELHVNTESLSREAIEAAARSSARSTEFAPAAEFSGFVGAPLRGTQLFTSIAATNIDHKRISASVSSFFTLADRSTLFQVRLDKDFESGVTISSFAVANFGDDGTVFGTGGRNFRFALELSKTF
ncbi:MAG: hypothetical protein ACOZAA_01850 [Pseudomonadota bacterium]